MTQLQESVSVEEGPAQARCRRLRAVRQRLESLKIDGLVVSRPCDIQYLTGFCGHDSLLVIAQDGAACISDNRYDEQLNPVRSEALFEVVIGVRHRLPDVFPSLCRRLSTSRVGIQADHMTVAFRARLQGAIQGVAIIDTSGVVEALRMRKDPLEIEAISHAIAINEAALSATLPQISVGMTEQDVSATLEYEMKRRGAFASGFRPIIAAGPHASLPHYETADGVIQANSALLIDWGTTAGGYNADLTRTFGIGSMPPRIAEIYSIVLDAQMAAIDAIRPGRICAEIDAVARDHIRRAGFGDYFGHGLGHGLGMEVHEAPFFNSLQTDVVLEPGITMTVEPGIYLPGVGGVRVEDNIVVTETGCRVLSSFRKGLAEVILPVKGSANTGRKP